jgi:hypothetical protein
LFPIADNIAELNTIAEIGDEAGLLVDYEALLRAENIWYCSFCTDPILDRKYGRICMECGAIMCLQDQYGSSGCIMVGTLRTDKEFRCIVCLPRKGRPVYYGVAGFGHRKPTKLTWPLLLVTLTLKHLNNYLATSITNSMQYVYRDDATNVIICPLMSSR